MAYFLKETRFKQPQSRFAPPNSLCHHSLLHLYQNYLKLVVLGKSWKHMAREKREIISGLRGIVLYHSLYYSSLLHTRDPRYWEQILQSLVSPTLLLVHLSCNRFELTRKHPTLVPEEGE